MIKYVALDLDGTLLDDQKKIHEVNLKKIRDMMANGVTFILISGRHHNQIARYANQIGLTIGKSGYIVSSDGFCITDIRDGSVTYFDELSSEDASCLAKAYGKYEITVVTNDEDYYLNDRPTMANHMINFVRKRIFHKHGTSCNHHYLNSMKKTIVCLLIHGVCDLEELGRVSDIYTKYEADVIDGTHVEIRQKSVSKWHAISSIMRNDGITTDEIAYFGNDMNDYSCFRQLKNTFAMGNAVDSVKRLSRYIVSSNNEDGIYQGLCILEETNHHV